MHHSGISCRGNGKSWLQSLRGPSFETVLKRLLRMRLSKLRRRPILMVRSGSAVRLEP
jgi:hypothetical protein